MSPARDGWGLGCRAQPAAFDDCWRQVVAIELAGIPVRVVRSYDTRDAGHSGDFGPGWSLDVHTARLEEARAPGAGWTVTAQQGIPPVFCVQPRRPQLVTVAVDGGTRQYYQWVTQQERFPIKTVSKQGNWSEEYRRVLFTEQSPFLFELPHRLDPAGPPANHPRR